MSQLETQYDDTARIEMAMEEARRHAADVNSSRDKDDEVTSLPLERIRVVANPRKHFDPSKLDELAANINEHGLIQPILVRVTKEPYMFELVSGERRFKAHQRLGRLTIKATVRDMSDEEALLYQTAENWQREDLSGYEKAVNINGLVQHYFAAELETIAKEQTLNDTEGLKQLLKTARKNEGCAHASTNIW